MQYDVPLIPQTTSMSCWAASMAMILSWRNQASFDPALIAQNGSGPSYMPSFKNGLDPNDKYILERNGFLTEPPECYLVSAVKHMLASFGPLWVATLAPAPHIRVVKGIVNETLYINDPGPVNTGSQYTMTFDKFFGAMEALGSSELSQPSPVYVAHLAAKGPI